MLKREGMRMNAAHAASLLETLIKGIDPITGETLDAEHVCANRRCFARCIWL